MSTVLTTTTHSSREIDYFQYPQRKIYFSKNLILHRLFSEYPGPEPPNYNAIYENLKLIDYGYFEIIVDDNNNNKYFKNKKNGDKIYILTQFDLDKVYEFINAQSSIEFMKLFTSVKTNGTYNTESELIKEIDTSLIDNLVSIFSNNDIFINDEGNNQFLDDLFENNILSFDNKFIGYENKLHNEKFNELEEFLKYNEPKPLQARGIANPIYNVPGSVGNANSARAIVNPTYNVPGSAGNGPSSTGSLYNDLGGSGSSGNGSGPSGTRPSSTVNGTGSTVNVSGSAENEPNKGAKIKNSIVDTEGILPEKILDDTEKNLILEKNIETVLMNILEKNLSLSNLNNDVITNLQYKYINEGSFGVVYEITYTKDSDNKSFVVKIPKTKDKSTNEYKKSDRPILNNLIKKERNIEACSSVLPIRRFGELSVSMLKLDIDLLDRNSKKKFKDNELNNIIKGIYESLMCLQKSTLYYYDIKPENILTRDEKIFLGDLGSLFFPGKEIPITNIPLNYHKKINSNQTIYNKFPKLYYPWVLSILRMELNLNTNLNLDGHSLIYENRMVAYDDNDLLVPDEKYTKGIEILNNIRTKQSSETKSYEYFVLEMVDETKLKAYDPNLNPDNYEKNCENYIKDFETFIGYSTSD